MTRSVPAPIQYTELLDREPALNPLLDEPVAVTLTPEHWQVLNRIYWGVLNSAAYSRDRPGRDVWGVWRWRRVQGLFRKIWRREGDCDDFAVEMLRRLVRHHDLFPRGCLRLARCIAPQGRGRRNGHLVLFVEAVTREAAPIAPKPVTWVLDILARGIRSIDHPCFKDYRWIDREEPGSRDWVSLAPPAAPPTLADLARRAG